MLTSYLKIAFAVLRRRKFFTFISLFGISLTLVVLMVAAALVDHVFAA
jgi:putative ABC transport system permease protein